jgi:hypothetical protein
MFRLSGYLLLLTLLGNLAFSEAEGTAEATPTQPVLIQFRVISQLQNFSKSWSSAYLSSEDEFLYFSKAIEKCLKKVEGNYEFEFKHFPQKLDENVFGVTIYLHDWKSSRNGIIENNFSARYEFGEEKGVIGSFGGRATQTIAPISSLRDRCFEDAVIDAGKRFVKKLQPLLDQHFKEGAEGAEK